MEVLNETEEQLMLLKDLTERTGILHEAQILQLKMYPLVIFQNAKEVRLELDIEKKELHFVSKFKIGNPKDFKVKCEQLESYVKWLLGTNWIVRVKDTKDKQLWRSRGV